MNIEARVTAAHGMIVVQFEVSGHFLVRPRLTFGKGQKHKIISFSLVFRYSKLHLHCSRCDSYRVSKMELIKREAERQDIVNM